MQTRSAFFPGRSVGKADIGGQGAGGAIHVEQQTARSAGNISQVARQGAWRFPSSRQYLWDRTAAEAQVLVDLQVCTQ